MPSYWLENLPRVLCLSIALSIALAACSPEIGDSCSTALDCSASGTRLCDETQPGGYCTLEACEANTCPEESVCVQFGRRFEGQPVDRLSHSFCMYKCDTDGDCRTDDDYKCFSGKSFGAGSEAEVLGNAKQKFCAATPSKLPTERSTEAQMSLPATADTKK